MEVLVCIKQVPGSTNVEVDPVTGVLKRDGVASKMNPYDLYALEAALELREKYGGSVRTITMGPPQARTVIEEAVCMGAEGGAVLSDRKFAGADVLATAYTLSQGIRRAGKFDLILCGKQTTDGDTAQVGAEISEYLSIPCVSNVLSIDRVEDGYIYVTATLDNAVVEEKVKMPCLISVDTDVNTPRLPSYRRKQTLKPEDTEIWSFADLPDRDETHYGLRGSATQVERIFPPERRTEKEVITGENAAQAVFTLMEERKLL